MVSKLYEISEKKYYIVIDEILFLSESAPTAAVKTRQFLFAKPGYVPVYIRPGDTPLEEINPDLAEAFNVYDQKNGRLFYGRYVGDKLNHDKNGDEVHKNSDIVILEQDKADKNEVDDSDPTHHIQKIPQPARR